MRRPVQNLRLLWKAFQAWRATTADAHAPAMNGASGGTDGRYINRYRDIRPRLERCMRIAHRRGGVRIRDRGRREIVGRIPVSGYALQRRAGLHLHHRRDHRPERDGGIVRQRRAAGSLAMLVEQEGYS